MFAIYCLSYGLFTVNKKRFSHQILLVLLMITFSIVYSRFEQDDVKASKLIGIKKSIYNILLFNLINPYFFKVSYAVASELFFLHRL